MIGVSSNTTSVTGDIINNIYKLEDGKYIAIIDTNLLIANKGYWINCSNDGNITIQYENDINLLTTTTIELVTGWNLIGTSQEAIIEENANIDQKNIYWFNPQTSKYENIINMTLISGRGYLIKTIDTFNMIVSFTS